jgi:uncharacterized protein
MFIIFAIIMSPRRKRYRRISGPPALRGYKPIGIPRVQLEEIILLFEEYEALKLADYEGLTQEEAAKRMDISRPTFTRIYDSCRKKLAQAFVEAKAIIIEGGDVSFDKNWYRCGHCYTIFEKDYAEKCDSCNTRDITNINTSLNKK